MNKQWRPYNKGYRCWSWIAQWRFVLFSMDYENKWYGKGNTGYWTCVAKCRCPRIWNQRKNPRRDMTRCLGQLPILPYLRRKNYYHVTAPLCNWSICRQSIHRVTFERLRTRAVAKLLLNRACKYQRFLIFTRIGNVCEIVQTPFKCTFFCTNGTWRALH